MPIIGHWKPGEKRRCKGKQALPHGKAEAVAKKMSKRSGEWLVAYQCYDCGWFHVGHADSTDLAIAAKLDGDFAEKKKKPKLALKDFAQEGE